MESTDCCLGFGFPCSDPSPVGFHSSRGSPKFPKSAGVGDNLLPILFDSFLPQVLSLQRVRQESPIFFLFWHLVRCLMTLRIHLRTVPAEVSSTFPPFGSVDLSFWSRDKVYSITIGYSVFGKDFSSSSDIPSILSLQKLQAIEYQFSKMDYCFGKEIILKDSSDYSPTKSHDF